MSQVTGSSTPEKQQDEFTVEHFVDDLFKNYGDVQTGGQGPLSPNNYFPPDSKELEAAAGPGLQGELLALLKEEEMKQRKLQEHISQQELLSSKLYAVYERTQRKLFEYREMERALSTQSGQLLKILQAEEGRAKTLSNSVKKVRHIRKDLLARIKDPKWERCHHYHMTCIEHNMGHRQPHCMEVAEMIPGHLRILALGRTSVLHHKSLLYSLERTKRERNQASDRIKEVYRDLRETRTDIKRVEKLLDAIRKKAYLFPNLHNMSARATQSARNMMMKSNRRDTSNAFRQRYFMSLSINATKLDKPKDQVSGTAIPRGHTLAENCDKEWKVIAQLVRAVESTKDSKQKAEEETQLLNARRIALLQSIPVPVLMGKDQEGGNKSGLDSDAEGLDDSDGEEGEGYPNNFSPIGSPSGTPHNSPGGGGGLVRRPSSNDLPNLVLS